MSSILWCYRTWDGRRAWSSYGGLESLEAVMRGDSSGRGRGEPLRVGRHIESAFAKLCWVWRLLWWILELGCQLLLVMRCRRRRCTSARRRRRRI